ncbi:D-2-hydroxyacid dehydrogenase [Peptostreptococcus canis]|uniref:D-2-hydroxyacid dehydrogenase n=1 Tax=Peptostreptococcus canis TaxID=1159213 RepID=A0ABR6TL47_9FIRM|nr:D-2-hydroxyacid dehydrogenase [Peptostreptococcus canis]MBC2576055.1 D-2-hydroxyacid dehydrogenase [Peptostreptococcus canis]MBP1997819.1 D-3-phosphoglycerate dehydrogenase [Peptostreptococcus canis]
MNKILVTDGMEKNAINLLKNMGFDVEEKFYEEVELKDKIKEIDIIVVRSATKIRKNIIDEAIKTKRLKMIIRGGVGLDNIDVDFAKANGIQVRNTPMASTNAVAELVLCEMLVLARKVKIANIKLQNGIWDKKNLKGNEIMGKTLGLVGYGKIAKNIADKANKLGMNILYTDVQECIENKEGFKFTDLDEILRESDYITIHTPLTNDTRNLFDYDKFKIMKDTAFIINCARGGIIVEEDLLRAIDNNEIAGAALDCFEDEPMPMKELLINPKVSVTPHIGGSTIEAQTRIGNEIVNIIEEYLAKSMVKVL